MKHKVDFLIVGQGLAGSILAYQLLQAGKSVFIIDKQKGATASTKASGLINPITGRRFVKSWQIDALLPYALKFYKTLERQFGVDLLQETKVHRIVQSVAQQNDWSAKSKESRYKAYLKNQDLIYHKQESIKNPLGCIEIEPVLKINTPLLIEHFSNFFIKKQLISRCTFDYDKLQVEKDKICYEAILAENIVFCEGVGAQKNPWFKDLPFVFSKGEVLHFRSKDLSQNYILGANTNISPLENNIFSVGATYAWDDLSMETTSKKKKELLEKLDAMICCSYTIIDQKAGVRPTVKDRRPIIGTHPNHKNMFIFNGMGTKGLSLAPYFAKQFICSFNDKTNLENEVSVSRFY